MFEDVTQHELLHPDNSSNFLPERYYCGCCIDTSPAATPGGWTGEVGIRSHMESQHGLDRGFLREGRDFFNGDQLRTKLIEWRRENEVAVERFGRSLGSIFTVDDLLFEAGA